MKNKLNIDFINTLKSMYDSNCVDIYTKDGQKFRINVTEFIKLLNETKRELVFEKKIKHTYITLGEVKKKKGDS